MELKTTKKFVVDGVSYDTKADANKAMSMKFVKECVSKGTQHVIDNAAEFIRSLNTITRK
jgi:hypothetical protein